MDLRSVQLPDITATTVVVGVGIVSYLNDRVVAYLIGLMVSVVVWALLRRTIVDAFRSGLAVRDGRTNANVHSIEEHRRRTS